MPLMPQFDLCPYCLEPLEGGAPPVCPHCGKNLRNRNPEIARGTSEMLDCADTDCCILRRTYAGESILIVLNIGREERALSLDAEALGYAALTDALNASAVGEKLRLGALIHRLWQVTGLENCRILSPAADVEADEDEVIRPGTITVNQMGVST